MNMKYCIDTDIISNDDLVFFSYCRCNNIAEMYGYNVEYSGVGETDKIPNLGYCSQIATFNRLQDISYDPIKKEDTYKFVIISLIFLQ